MLAVVVLVQAINHATEHRSQVFTSLTQQGLVVPELGGWGYFEDALHLSCQSHGRSCAAACLTTVSWMTYDGSREVDWDRSQRVLPASRSQPYYRTGRLASLSHSVTA